MLLLCNFFFLFECVLALSLGFLFLLEVVANVLTVLSVGLFSQFSHGGSCGRGALGSPLLGVVPLSVCLKKHD